MTIDDEHAQEVLDWLEHEWPGGEHIAPHWQNGPYWLTAITDVEFNDDNDGARLMMRVFRDASLLVRGRPEYGFDHGKLVDVRIYHLPDFAFKVLSHAETSSGYELINEMRTGPDATLDPAVLVRALPDLTRLDDLPELAALLDELATTRPNEALTAMRAIACHATSDSAVLEWFATVAEVTRESAT